MSVPDRLAAEVLAKCARHCCICRRYRPLHLQVHHIVERANGGTDDLDNLIPICVSCHSDVHTVTRLTRRFTVQELKLHRDKVYDLVESGHLPAGELGAETVETIAAAIIDRLRASDAVRFSSSTSLPSAALELLVAAVCEDAPIQVRRHEAGAVEFATGKQSFYLFPTEASARPPEPEERLGPLQDARLIRRAGELFYVTPAGATLVDEVVSVASQSRFTMTKVKCLKCRLHFILCTWHSDRHNANNIYCPECGQCQGRFAIWQQRQFGHIFQHVPGHARRVE